MRTAPALIGAVVTAHGLAAAAPARGDEPDFGPAYVGRVLVQGTRTHESAGIAFDAADRLFNVSLLGHSLRRFDASTGSRSSPARSCASRPTARWRRWPWSAPASTDAGGITQLDLDLAQATEALAG